MSPDPEPSLLVATYLSLLERAQSVPALLPQAEQAHGRRLVALCSDIEAEALSASLTTRLDVISTAELALRQELGRLVEFLARRHAAGIPLATLGRATLAGLAGRRQDFARTCEETNQKLLLLGL